VDRRGFSNGVRLSGEGEVSSVEEGVEGNGKGNEVELESLSELGEQVDSIRRWLL